MKLLWFVQPWPDAAELGWQLQMQHRMQGAKTGSHARPRAVPISKPQANVASLGRVDSAAKRSWWPHRRHGPPKAKSKKRRSRPAGGWQCRDLLLHRQHAVDEGISVASQASSATNPANSTRPSSTRPISAANHPACS